MERKPKGILLSDYDGTLCPTTSVRGDSSNSSGMIPNELEQALVQLSERIPLCIISSKDFAFLHERVRFANILYCALGIETIIHNPHYNDKEIVNFDCVRYQHLIASSHSLMDNSKSLRNVMNILESYKDITIEEKYNSNKEILIGLTIDHRYLENWQLFKENKEPSIRDVIQRTINANLAPNSYCKDKPLVQKYSSHPFLDVYGRKNS